jgi:hypothetical protein
LVGERPVRRPVSISAAGTDGATLPCAADAQWTAAAEKAQSLSILPSSHVVLVSRHTRRRQLWRSLTTSALFRSWRACCWLLVSLVRPRGEVKSVAPKCLLLSRASARGEKKRYRSSVTAQRLRARQLHLIGHYAQRAYWRMSTTREDATLRRKSLVCPLRTRLSCKIWSAEIGSKVLPSL